MQWTDIRFDTNVWEIPAADMKAAKPHVVPLSTSVVKLLNERRKALARNATMRAL
jgi:integrase